MLPLIYQYLVYPALQILFRIAAVLNPKARIGLLGRRQWRLALGEIHPPPNAFRVHFHAASVGEFEQAKPLIQALRAEAAPHFITASFFSSSGYKGQSGYEHLDAACYLPPDTQSEVNAFLDTIAPQLIILMRYDLWYQFLRAAHERDIPIVLACGGLRPDSVRFYPVLRRFFRQLYSLCTMILAASPADQTAFRGLLPGLPVHCEGDTRYDRVRQVAQEAAGRLPVALGREALGSPDRILVAGSTWPADERLLAQVMKANPNVYPVIVPHEPTPQNVASVLAAFPGTITLSELEANPGKASAARGLVIDRTGILSALYSIAHIAFVGGGFGAGVHSVLEPAAYGLPVFTGPRIGRSRDAMELQTAGGLHTVTDAAALESRMASVSGQTTVADMRHIISHFMAQRYGATQRILSRLRKIEDF